MVYCSENFDKIRLNQNSLQGKFYINYSTDKFMEEVEGVEEPKKLSIWWFIAIIVFIGLVISGVTLFLIGGGEETSQEDEDSQGGQDIQENQQVLEEQEQGNQTEDDLNQTENNITEEIFFDLTALNLTLENGGCSKEENETTFINTTKCILDATGVLKNTGTETIEDDFVVQFLDTTESASGSLIEVILVNDNLTPGEEKILTIVYRDILPGNYVVRFKVDAVRNIDEQDETNNELSKFIKIK